MKNFMVALDNMKDKEIYSFLDEYSDNIHCVKIGLEAYLRYGRPLIKQISNDYGIEIFLDLKLHDIPTTVSKAIRSLKGLPIKFLTIHLSGGEEMIEQAMIARDEHLPDCKILGVSILTSLDTKDTLSMWDMNTEEVFKRYFSIALKCKIDGIVSSGQELIFASQLDKKKEVLRITPGIRLDNDSSSDQKRVMTPKKALSLGADYLVIGRTITTAKRPCEVLEYINQI